MENLSAHSEHAYAHYLSYYFTVDTASAELDVLPWLSPSAFDCVCEGVLGYHSNE
jgi:hypothetical protein